MRTEDADKIKAVLIGLLFQEDYIESTTKIPPKDPIENLPYICKECGMTHLSCVCTTNGILDIIEEAFSSV